MGAWPQPALDALAEASTLRRYARHEQIAPDDPGHADVLVVVNGSLETGNVNAVGAKFILSVLGAGEITGLVNLLTGQPRPMYGYAVREDSLVVHVPAAPMRAVLDAHPALWRDIALIALRRQQGHIAVMEQRALAPIPQQIAQTLARLAHWSGRPEGERDVALRISQADLAFMLNLSRQTVNRELGALAKAGLLSAHYGRLTLHDVAALQRLAAG